MEQSIQTIAATVEARDPYTAGHQERVAELATAIAREMKLSEEVVKGIHFASIIHDLGKIHIPAEILSKLNDIEFMLIKTHPQSGYEILKDVTFPWPIADIIPRWSKFRFCTLYLSLHHQFGIILHIGAKRRIC